MSRLTSTPWKLDPEDEDEEKLPGEKITDSAKLKGIQWPGMAVFDAATPEGKRMRNQRKNSKVLRDMIATSEGVEPAEISYHSNGEFRASRDIFGPLSTENSPVCIFLCSKPNLLILDRSNPSVLLQRSVMYERPEKLPSMSSVQTVLVSGQHVGDHQRPLEWVGVESESARESPTRTSLPPTITDQTSLHNHLPLSILLLASQAVTKIFGIWQVLTRKKSID